MGRMQQHNLFPGSMEALLRLCHVYAAGRLISSVLQDVVLPKEHCDERVEIMQADARELDIQELFAKSKVGLQASCKM